MKREKSNVVSLEELFWKSANRNRGMMDADEYKTHFMRLVFFKYLSDTLLGYVSNKLIHPKTNLLEMQKLYEEYYHTDENSMKLVEEFGYAIEPNQTFTALMNSGNKESMSLSILNKELAKIKSKDGDISEIFSASWMYSQKLEKMTEDAITLSIIQDLEEINFNNYTQDEIGNAVEMLIKRFAADAGKIGGEYYTPEQISSVIMQVALSDKYDEKHISMYDPTMGTASMLLNAKKYIEEETEISYYGQELNIETYNIARMNMIMHGVKAENQHLSNNNSLGKNWPKMGTGHFDVVVLNPPYSMRWDPNPNLLYDERFSRYGALPPKSKADYAFLLQGYYHLKENEGTMVIVLPHGVLFRGASEQKIRTQLLKDGAIDTIIGLPSNMFYATSIPTVIIVLKKGRMKRDVLFIDASKEYEKNKTQNILTEENISNIVETYKKRVVVEQYSYLASFEEIEANDFNLNIPRYVDISEKEVEVPISEIINAIADTQLAIEESVKNLNDSLEELMKEI